jgi:DNA-binding phage protein
VQFLSRVLLTADDISRLGSIHRRRGLTAVAKAVAVRRSFSDGGRPRPTDTLVPFRLTPTPAEENHSIHGIMV